MLPRSALPVAFLLTFAATAAAHAPNRPPLLPSTAAHYPPGAHYEPLCPEADARGRRCFGQILVDANDVPIADATSPPGGWTPGELEAAYGLPATGGPSTIIATYIGNHYTNAEADVATYRTQFGMTPCTSASGCFTQITDSGSTDFSGLTDDGCSGFIGEESLDIDMLMAGCPSCKILVIEGNDHASAITTAAARGAVSMSMSWGYGASASDCSGVWVPPAGLALFGASGDQGYTASPGAPSACADVIAVGWTQLATDSSVRGYADTLPANWGSAGGCDTIIDKASWQTDTGCSSRMISDISANGDNVAAYCTSPTKSAGWHVTGGSSAASPFTTGVLATLGVTGGAFNAQWLYTHAQSFWDVTSGGPVQNCPSGSPDYFCNAVPGYDGPTGVGTPYGPTLLGVDAGSSACATPTGSYSQSCTGCASEQEASGCILTCASCTTVAGTQNANPSLPLPCGGSVVNDNGDLVCVGAPTPDAGAHDGPSDASVSGDATVPTAPVVGGDASAVFAADASMTGSRLAPGGSTPSTSASVGCSCDAAGAGRSSTPALLAAAMMVLAGGARRRRKALTRG